MSAMKFEPILSAETISVGYDNKAVAEGITLNVQRGEILSLIGPNGAGKTTLLKTLARQLEPVAGTVFLEKEELAVYKPPELAQKMAVVFSDALRPERMTCREAVAAGRYPYTGKFGTLSEQDIEVIENAMQRVHVEELADRQFDAISDGQRQRVVLARALAQEPEVILLDEPTTFLDIKWKVEFLSALQELSRNDGLTVILTLHELDLARNVSDRVACLKDHRLDRVDTPDAIFEGDYIPELFDMDGGAYKNWFCEMN